jgi:hypothetical protein
MARTGGTHTAHRMFESGLVKFSPLETPTHRSSPGLFLREECRNDSLQLGMRKPQELPKS